MGKTASGGLLAAGAMALACPQGALAATGACPNPAFQKQAQAAIQLHQREVDSSGAALVAVDGKPVLRRGFGLADRELGVPNTPQMKFRIGSITKQFTAAAILQLQEAGKLQLDDPISKYYPEAPPAWSKVTLRHLLTHTSGIPSYTDLPEFAQASRLPQTTDSLIKLIRDKPLQFEPGKGFYYDNSGYLLLTYVIEKVSGEPYADYLQRRLFQPLGMNDTGYDNTSQILPGRARGYERGLEDRIWHNIRPTDMTWPQGAGGLYSTVDDLLKWDQALSSGRVLKPESQKAMFADYGRGYGFGWYVDQQWGQERIWHGGDIDGFSTQFQRYPKARLTVVVLFNESTPPAKLAVDLAGLCLGAEVYPHEVAETAADLRRYAGYYDSGSASVLKIEPRDGVLATRNFQTGDTHLYPSGGGTFFGKTFDVRVAFEAGADGQVTGMLLTPGGKTPPTLSYKRVDPAEGERLLAVPVAQRLANARAKAAAAAKAPAP